MWTWERIQELLSDIKADWFLVFWLSKTQEQPYFFLNIIMTFQSDNSCEMFITAVEQSYSFQICLHGVIGVGKRKHTKPLVGACRWMLGWWWGWKSRQQYWYRAAVAWWSRGRDGTFCSLNRLEGVCLMDHCGGRGMSRVYAVQLELTTWTSSQASLHFTCTFNTVRIKSVTFRLHNGLCIIPVMKHLR